MNPNNLLDEKIIWSRQANPEFPFVANFNGEECFLRLNDFPAENLYTLILSGKEVADFNDWPTQWIQTKQQFVGQVAAD